MRFTNKPLIKYRFKDSMGCVFYRTFYTDHEAMLWYERNKLAYTIKEFNSAGLAYSQNRTLIRDYPSLDI